MDALKSLITAHGQKPVDTLDGLKKQLDEILESIDPRCEDH
jgi:hypothetical protein